MRNFYLFEPALRVNSIDDLENGLNNLNEIILNKDTIYDNFFCNATIWECDTTQGKIYDFFGGIVNEELQRIIPFIFQSFHESDLIFGSIDQMEVSFPNDCNGFVGFQFVNTNIVADKKVLDLFSYSTFVKKCLKFGHIRNTDDIKTNLKTLYPTYDFSDRAIQECLNWKSQNVGLYERIHDLLEDIINNPFTGGIGETEVLRHIRGVASKRINQAHRITYKLENSRVIILACSGHYD